MQGGRGRIRSAMIVHEVLTSIYFWFLSLRHCFLDIAELMYLIHNFVTKAINDLFAFINFIRVFNQQKKEKTLYLLESTTCR